ncbi:MAG: hypothetical protein ACXVXB_04850 [Nocardioidaceae bacterium]
MAELDLDALVSRVLRTSAFRYTLAETPAERDLAFRLRGRTVLDEGWGTAGDFPDGRETDEYDGRALHVLGWDGAVAMCTGRVVLPPGLPTEDACGLVVEPAGEVVDVGRMCVARSHQSLQHAAFVGLMCRLYLEMRAHGYAVAAGMMTVQAQSLVRLLGLRLERLGPPRGYWGEQRTPVRFLLTANAESLRSRWDRWGRWDRSH